LAPPFLKVEGFVPYVFFLTPPFLKVDMHELSVCLCIKNEAKYMEEFINHYLRQGVDHFYIVNNGSTDNIEEVIEGYKDKITLITDNRDFQVLTSDESWAGHKRMLDEHIYPRIVHETKWAIIVDADEFMTGKNGYTIKSYLDSLSEDIGCVYVLWNIYNPCKEEDGSVCETFSTKKNVKRINHDCMASLSWEIRNANDFGKSIIRTSMIDHGFKLWIHKIPIIGKKINNYGIEDHAPNNDNWNNIHYSEENFKKANITLNHYAIRNLSDLNKKKSQLGVVTHKHAFITGLIQMCDLDNSVLIEDPLEY
jgi:glycosyltransferase involved in cell wall biosynthesis